MFGIRWACRLPYFLLGEVTLSFLGLGLAEPDPSFGNMLSGAVATASLLGAHWWTWAVPATALTLAVLGSNLLLEGLRQRYAAELGSDPPPGRGASVSWTPMMSRLRSSSIWGSKHLRQRAS